VGTRCIPSGSRIRTQTEERRLSSTPLDQQSPRPRAPQPAPQPVPSSASEEAPSAASVGPDEAALEATVSGADERVRKGMEQVQESDHLRTEKIFELRGKIASGEYKIDADTLAKRLVDHL